MALVRGVLVGGMLFAAVGSQRADQGGVIDRLTWLQGCWVANSPRRVIEEQWTAPRGRMMLGVARTLRGDSVVEYEFVVVREQGGGLTYEAHPSGQPSAVFTASGAGDSVVFENPAHDSPQRVGYRRQGADSLLAWIDGVVNGQRRRVEFPYARVRCPGD